MKGRRANPEEMNTGLPDFDTLLQMAREDPEALERFRQAEIAALIEQADDDRQHRLRGLQFQIDAQRQTAGSAMSACIRVSRMMHDSFDRLRLVLQQIAQGSDEPLLATDEPTRTTSAEILQFKR